MYIQRHKTQSKNKFGNFASTNISFGNRSRSVLFHMSAVAVAESLAARALSEEGRRLLFTEARTKQFFLPKPVPEAKLKEIYELMKWGPTSANCCPLRIKFLSSEAARLRLAPLTAEGNQAKVRGAPVTAILAWDVEYYEQLPRLMPPLAGLRDVFKNAPEISARNGKQSADLGAAYFILAARAVGLDAGPMGGFNNEEVDKAFFLTQEGAQKNWKSTMLINLGYGDDTKVFPRAPRLPFDEACLIE